MKNECYLAKDALAMLKAGYHLEAEIDHQKEDFYYSGGSVLVLSENKELRLNPYRFLELYQDTKFLLSDLQQDEETVDIKKDEEYYSWRQ